MSGRRATFGLLSWRMGQSSPVPCTVRHPHLPERFRITAQGRLRRPGRAERNTGCRRLGHPPVVRRRSPGAGGTISSTACRPIAPRNLGLSGPGYGRAGPRHTRLRRQALGSDGQLRRARSSPRSPLGPGDHVPRWLVARSCDHSIFTQGSGLVCAQDCPHPAAPSPGKLPRVRRPEATGTSPAQQL